MATKGQELPNTTGKGVEPLNIPAIARLITKYEKKKEARCAESPGERDAKKELQAALHSLRDQLPVNEDGNHYYRSTDYERDYILTEKLQAVKFSDEDPDEE